MFSTKLVKVEIDMDSESCQSHQGGKKNGVCPECFGAEIGSPHYSRTGAI
jgi:hypothetical protein